MMRPNRLPPFCMDSCAFGALNAVVATLKITPNPSNHRFFAHFQSVMWIARTAKAPEILHECMQKGGIKFDQCADASNFNKILMNFNEF